MRPTSSCRPRLYRKGRHLRQHRRPRAVRRQGRVRPGDAREDWTILRALADALGVSVGFDSFDELRAAMIAPCRRWASKAWPITARCPRRPGGQAFEGVIGYPIKDFYLTNPIARASAVMQRCSAELLHGGGGGMSFAEAAE
jgi:NADH-quinone oxidoreductase subunit G